MLTGYFRVTANGFADYPEQAIGAMAFDIAARHPFDFGEVVDASRRLVSQSQQGFVGKDPKRSAVTPLRFMFPIKVKGF